MATITSSRKVIVPITSRQFSLRNLLLLVFGISLSMGLERYAHRAHIDATDGVRTLYDQYQFTTRLLIVPIAGAGFAALFLTLTQRQTGSMAFPSEPGHWLMFNFGALYFLEALPRLLFALHITSLANITWIVAGINLAMTLIQAAILSKVHYSKYWHTVLGVEVLRRAAGALFNSVHALVASLNWTSIPLGLSLTTELLFPLSVVVSICALIYAISCDVIIKKHRDLFHWGGCAGQLVLLIMYALNWIISLALILST